MDWRLRYKALLFRGRAIFTISLGIWWILRVGILMKRKELKVGQKEIVYTFHDNREGCFWHLVRYRDSVRELFGWINGTKCAGEDDWNPWPCAPVEAYDGLLSNLTTVKTNWPSDMVGKVHE